MGLKLELTYQKAGVNVNNADMLSGLIKESLKTANIGRFAALYEHPYIRDYYLVACTDGVGTKVMPLFQRNDMRSIAQDLVAMNLNDLVCTGAFPLFFLDYIATNNLEVDTVMNFVNELKNTLLQYNCALIGGETSELKDLIKENSFDVAGFAVGMLKKDKLLSSQNVKSGDVVIGLSSSGPHSNGFTLIRMLKEQGLIDDDLFEISLKPTNIYVKEILELCDQDLIKVCANITGGGVVSNLSRVIPEGYTAILDKKSIPEQRFFKFIKEIIEEKEAYNTFNMGVGMCIIVADGCVQSTLDICKGYNPFIFGKIEKNEKNSRVWLR